jgi:hypothetical protein
MYLAGFWPGAMISPLKQGCELAREMYNAFSHLVNPPKNTWSHVATDPSMRT